MRQALSVALIEYTGALVVISHDRHLLRSVCDELMIVHDGIVDRFNRSLDEYPAWLKEQQANADQTIDGQTENKSPKRQANRKQQRKNEAQRRQRLKPLLDKVRDIERQLATSREKLEVVEKNLADESIYTDSERNTELADLVKNQATLKSAIDTLEWEWMEASEEVETAG